MPLHRADRDLPALTVLALLLTGPRHTYEMHRMIIDSHKDFVTGLPRSLYHAVDRLLKAELIVIKEVNSQPGRPDRTVYTLTARGRANLRDKVTRLLETPDPDSTGMQAALSFIGALPPERAVTALRKRQQQLQAALGSATAGLAATGTTIPRLLLIEVEYEAARLGAELEWTTALVADIADGRLTWPGNIDELVAAMPPMTTHDPDEENT